MLKKIIALCFVIIMCIVPGGCSNSSKNEINWLRNEALLKDSKIQELEKDMEELKKQTKLLDSRLKYEESRKAALEEKVSDNKNYYGVYTADDFTMVKQTYLWVYIPWEKPIEEKLDILSNVLSQTLFDDLPIEVVKVEERDGKRIALINLMESDENQKISGQALFMGKSWAAGYFQGSTGGSITSISLIETFLQKQYNGDWIDGVRFLYNNGIEAGWSDHAPNLGKVNYRK